MSAYFLEKAETEFMLTVAPVTLSRVAFSDSVRHDWNTCNAQVNDT